LEFLLTSMRRIYLDNNATTEVSPTVLKAMLPYYNGVFGNPSSVHSFGQEAKAALDLSRQQVAKLLEVEPNEIVFTGGGTESDNLAIRGIIEASPGTDKHIITSQIEHHAVLHTCQSLEKMGIEVSYLPVNRSGQVDPNDVSKAIKKNTLMISIMHANNEIGTLQPVNEIGKIAKANEIYFHVDAIQSVGKLLVNPSNFEADLVSLSAHKFHGPKGIGALYVKKGTRLRPMIFGGSHERNRRAGTENVPQIVGLGHAAELALKEINTGSQSIYQLKSWFEDRLLELIPETKINGINIQRLPNTTNIRFSNAEAEGLIINLDLAGVACSTGSACTSGSIEPSHVLTALGLSPEEAFECLRFSLSKNNTLEELTHVLDLLPSLVDRQREISPLGIRSYPLIS